MNWMCMWKLNVSGVMMRVMGWDGPGAEAVYDDGWQWATSEEAMPPFGIYIPPIDDDQPIQEDDKIELKEKLDDNADAENGTATDENNEQKQ